jgi:aminoglycoside 6'-N-acetyltransferase
VVTPGADGPATTAAGPADPSGISFRPLGRHDFGLLVDWLDRPHVARWWTDPTGPDAVEAEYGPVVDGTDRTRAFLIVVDGRPVGFIQAYLLEDEPDYARDTGVADGAGIDLFVGEAEVMGGGFGSSVLRRFVDEVVWPGYPDVARAMAGPSVHNTRSQRAFEKAGFTRTRVAMVAGEPDPEQVMVLERPTARP